MSQVQQRDYRFELIRVVAVFLVIGVHLLYLYPQDGTALRTFSIHVLNILFPCCNALFFFMSGRFALRRPVADEELGNFYFKKFVFLLIPLLIYSVIYAVGKLWVDQQSLDGLGQHTLASLSALNSSTHLWYMYVLVGHILVSPFTSRFIAQLTRRSTLVFIAMGILYNLCYIYAPYFSGQPFGWVFPFGGWIFYFYLGGCLDKIVTTEKEERWLMAVGAVCFFYILFKQYFCEFKEHITDLNPTFSLFALSVYLFLQRITIVNDKAKQIICFLGKRSYSMYLILYVVVYLLTSCLPETHTMPDLLFLLLVMTASFVIGLVSSYLFDLFVIQQIQKGMLLLKDFVAKK